MGRDNIIRAAYRKLSDPDDGKKTNLRVTRDVFWNGAFTDEEICAEYFGGLLANSRTEDGRSDEGIQFVDVIKSLSASQLKLHYIIYKALNENMVNSKMRINVTLSTEIESVSVFFSSIEIQEHENIDIGLGLNVLHRQNLISEYKYDTHSVGGKQFPYMSANPTTFGVFLYAAAHSRLSDSVNFNRLNFGDFEGATFPKYHASTLEELRKKVGLS